MDRRLRALLVALIAIAAVAAVAAAVIASKGGNDSGVEEEPTVIVHNPSKFKGAERPPIPVKEFKLIDQDGKLISFNDYRGKVIVVTFLYSHCEDTCPVQARMIAGALDDLGDRAEEIPVLAISVDPANDTAESVRKFLMKTKTYGRIHFLLGSKRRLKPVWKQFAIQPQTDGLEHSAYIILVDRHGNQRVGHPAGSTTPEQIAHDLRILLAQNQKKSVTRTAKLKSFRLNE